MVCKLSYAGEQGIALFSEAIVPWIESHSVLVRHRKLKEFARELKIKPVTAMGHLHALWHTAIEQAEDGDLSKWSEGAICDAAQWEGSEKEFLEAVLSSGFMDTGYLLHDWLDYAGRYLTSKYKTSNHERLVEIWAKFGKVYGKELKRNSLSVPKDSPPNLTEPNQPNLPTNPAGKKFSSDSPETHTVFDAYPNTRKINGKSSYVGKTLNDYNLIAGVLNNKPDYPLLEIVKLYAASTEAPKDLRGFLAALPDPATLRNASPRKGVQVDWAPAA